MALVALVRKKGPNSKLQAPGKHQTPNRFLGAQRLFGVLVLGASLELGAWNLKLGRTPMLSPLSLGLMLPGLARVFARLRQRIPLRQQEQAGNHQCRRQAHEHAIPAPALMEETGDRAAEDRTKRPAAVDQSCGGSSPFPGSEV